ncbi:MULTISPECIES: hypothetical protein [Nostoc]|uniref:hypothetical protein n=1 Tax=Nostoc TaxID=1177 RepID=UPI001F54EC68|nr:MULTISPECIES: hypothetical protein [Nostoc]
MTTTRVALGESAQAMSVATLEKFLKDDLKHSPIRSQGCLYQYLETKKLQDGSTALYPRVIGERDPQNPKHWHWGYNWEEKVQEVWKGRSIGSIPWSAVPLIWALLPTRGYQGRHHRLHQESQSQKATFWQNHPSSQCTNRCCTVCWGWWYRSWHGAIWYSSGDRGGV